MQSGRSAGSRGDRAISSVNFRRAHPRLQCKGLAQIKLAPGEQPLPGWLMDLSISGCCIEWAEPVRGDVGSAIEIQLTVKGSVLRLMGVIRYIHGKKRTGIEFTQVSHRKREQIDAVIREVLEMRRLAFARCER